MESPPLLLIIRCLVCVGSQGRLNTVAFLKETPALRNEVMTKVKLVVLYPDSVKIKSRTKRRDEAKSGQFRVSPSLYPCATDLTGYFESSMAVLMKRIVTLVY